MGREAKKGEEALGPGSGPSQTPPPPVPRVKYLFRGPSTEALDNGASTRPFGRGPSRGGAHRRLSATCQARREHKMEQSARAVCPRIKPVREPYMSRQRLARQR